MSCCSPPMQRTSLTKQLANLQQSSCTINPRVSALIDTSQLRQHSDLNDSSPHPLPLSYATLQYNAAAAITNPLLFRSSFTTATAQIAGVRACQLETAGCSRYGNALRLYCKYCTAAAGIL
eukprot:8190-Heterococcus_DN1.PRE.4